MTKKLFVIVSTLFIAAGPATAGTCWYQTAYYVPWNCDHVGYTPAGKYLLICCD
jgi:hypothetical protein